MGDIVKHHPKEVNFGPHTVANDAECDVTPMKRYRPEPRVLFGYRVKHLRPKVVAK